MRRFRFPLLTGALALSLALGACGDDDGAGVRSSGDAEPAEGDAAGDDFPVTLSGGVVVEAAPERIVSLSATATEILFAIDAGDAVVAVDEQSDYPEEAPTTDLSGYNVNVEAIVAYDPDLVVASFDPGGLVDGLDAVDVPVLLHPTAANLDEAYEQIDELGQATGRQDEAGELVEDMQADIERLAGEAPAREEPLTYYYELDDTLYTVTKATFIGELYALAGLENIADPLDDGSGFPQLSNEAVIAADPDLIFLADTECCAQSLATVSARPGWAGIQAVRTGAVIELDDDIASRWGPRAVDLLELVIEAVKAVPAGGVGTYDG